MPPQAAKHRHHAKNAVGSASSGASAGGGSTDNPKGTASFKEAKVLTSSATADSLPARKQWKFELLTLGYLAVHLLIQNLNIYQHALRNISLDAVLLALVVLARRLLAYPLQMDPATGVASMHPLPDKQAQASTTHVPGHKTAAPSSQPGHSIAARALQEPTLLVTAASGAKEALLSPGIDAQQEGPSAGRVSRRGRAGGGVRGLEWVTLQRLHTAAAGVLLLLYVFIGAQVLSRVAAQGRLVQCAPGLLYPLLWSGRLSGRPPSRAQGGWLVRVATRAFRMLSRAQVPGTLSSNQGDARQWEGPAPPGSAGALAAGVPGVTGHFKDKGGNGGGGGKRPGKEKGGDGNRDGKGGGTSSNKGTPSKEEGPNRSAADGHGHEGSKHVGHNNGHAGQGNGHTGYGSGHAGHTSGHTAGVTTGFGAHGSSGTLTPSSSGSLPQFASVGNASREHVAVAALGPARLLWLVLGDVCACAYFVGVLPLVLVPLHFYYDGWHCGALVGYVCVGVLVLLLLTEVSTNLEGLCQLSHAAGHWHRCRRAAPAPPAATGAPCVQLGTEEAGGLYTGSGGTHGGGGGSRGGICVVQAGVWMDGGAVGGGGGDGSSLARSDSFRKKETLGAAKWDPSLVPYEEGALVVSHGWLYLAVCKANEVAPGDLPSAFLFWLCHNPTHACDLLLLTQLCVVGSQQILMLNTRHWKAYAVMLLLNYCVLYMCLWSRRQMVARLHKNRAITASVLI